MHPLRFRLRLLRRYVQASFVDLGLFVSRRAERDLPPTRLRFVGAGDFRAVGEDMVRQLAAAGLRPDARVLDVGCGIGRVAIPLRTYLDSKGRYDGFDIVPSAIRWCRRHIGDRRFRFTHANVFNSFYHRRGVPAAQFRFPYGHAAFDFAFATSVFTHLSLDATRTYLRETHRVLRPGGTLFATFFLFDDDTIERMNRGGTAMRFPFDRGDYRLSDPDLPDEAIALRASLLPELLAGFDDVQVQRGAWAGGEGSFQDVVVAKRS